MFYFRIRDLTPQTVICFYILPYVWTVAIFLVMVSRTYKFGGFISRVNWAGESFQNGLRSSSEFKIEKNSPSATWMTLLTDSVAMFSKMN